MKAGTDITRQSAEAEAGRRCRRDRRREKRGRAVRRHGGGGDRRLPRLGRAITQAFAAEGGRVMICDLVESGYFAGNPTVATVTGDIGSPGLADTVIAAAVSRWGQVDILVNDAASYPDGTLLEMPGEAWDRVFRVNVTGTFMMTQAFARHCVSRRAENAAVVSISSGSARNPRPGGAAYSASKAAVETMSKVFAMELGPHGIRVNVVSPGYIDVRQWSEAFPDRAPEELRAALVRSIPLGQAGDPARHRAGGAVPGLPGGRPHHRRRAGGRRRVERRAVLARNLHNERRRP